MSITLESVRENTVLVLAETYAKRVKIFLDSSDRPAERVQLHVKARFESIFLVPLLEQLIEEVTDPKVRGVLQENLLEELGQHPNYGIGSHEASRERLLTALEIENFARWSDMRIETVLVDRSPSFLLGMLYYTEYQVPSEYEAIDDQIQKHFAVTPEDRQHLTDHIEHDIEHSADLHAVLASFAELDLAELEAGARFMHDLRLEQLAMAEMNF